MNETVNYQLAISLAKSAIERSSAQDICARTGAVLLGECGVSVRVLDRTYTISWTQGDLQVTRDGTALATYDFEAIVLLHYLVHADGTPLTGEWIPFRKLPEAFGGYSTSFEGRAVRPIVARFGNDIDGFKAASAALGGKPIDVASDTSFVYPFMPYLPIAILFWQGDEEFDARASFLFDQTASHYLPTEDVTVAASLLASRLKRV